MSWFFERFKKSPVKALSKESKKIYRIAEDTAKKTLDTFYDFHEHFSRHNTKEELYRSTINVCLPLVPVDSILESAKQSSKWPFSLRSISFEIFNVTLKQHNGVIRQPYVSHNDFIIIGLYGEMDELSSAIDKVIEEIIPSDL